MSGQRNSGHKRRKHDLYETPAWVVLEGLVGHFPVTGLVVGEMACGTCKMAKALTEAGAAAVLCSDITWRGGPLTKPYHGNFVKFDFSKRGYDREADALVTNPPYGLQGILAEQFIERGLDWLRRKQADAYRRAPIEFALINPGDAIKPRLQSPAFMALLLSADFDMAGSRIHLFERCPDYHGVIRLRRRIEWFKRKRDPETGKVGSGPSKHHAWFIWKAEPRAHGVEPVTLYAPSMGVLI